MSEWWVILQVGLYDIYNNNDNNFQYISINLSRTSSKFQAICQTGLQGISLWIVMGHFGKLCGEMTNAPMVGHHITESERGFGACPQILIGKKLQICSTENDDLDMTVIGKQDKVPTIASLLPGVGLGWVGHLTSSI